MFRRDYMMRMIQEMTELMATISGLKKQHKQEQAFTAVDELLGRFFRLNGKLLNALSEKDILAMFSTGGFLEAEKVLILARVLKEEGSLYESLEEPEECYRRYVKGLSLALEASRQENPPTELAQEVVRELHEAIRSYELPIELQDGLLDHYIRSGEYAKAEDCLYELAEAGGPFAYAENRTEAGERFYGHLLERSEEELERGGLPLGEVLEGQMAYRAKYGK
ncbi:DUF6483 family protein [Gorillibacterium sp. CAU 1737]|uniref:DUF6483 family protein n=1 Tax=Gorillibacterium sp. CAU 1737 TaxID=3140362 RepID=UPI003260690D